MFQISPAMSLNIVIVYASAGSGHRRAAQAIYDCLKRGYPDINIIFIDILEYANLLFSSFYSQGYAFLVRRLKPIWAVTYWLTSLKCISWLFKLICRLNSQRFINLLIKVQPEIILSTHFFSSEVVAYLKQKGNISSRLITVITDFGVHPLWVIKHCDEYIVGSDSTRNRLIYRGIKSHKISLLGTPIDSRFMTKYRQDKRPGVTSALVVTGIFGFSLIEKVVRLIYTELSLLVVCGNNKKLYNRLSQGRYRGVRVFGFTEEMPRLMSEVDFIITKPGGLTIAEAIAMDLPLIFIGSIPGQETENARILEGNGCAIVADNLSSLKSIVIDLKAHPERLDLMRENIYKFKKPDATEKICQFIMKDIK